MNALAVLLLFAAETRAFLPPSAKHFRHQVRAINPRQCKLSASTSADVEELPKWIQSTNELTVDAIKAILALLISEDRPYARFYALETIARVPYFSYTSVLHLYETFGWLRKSEYIKIHFAESWYHCYLFYCHTRHRCL